MYVYQKEKRRLLFTLNKTEYKQMKCQFLTCVNKRDNQTVKLKRIKSSISFSISSIWSFSQ